MALPSKTHTHSPRIGSENFFSLLHDAGVRAFVDGVGHYGDVVVFQGDVVGMRELQQLVVFVPAGIEVRLLDRCSMTANSSSGLVRQMNDFTHSLIIHVNWRGKAEVKKVSKCLTNIRTGLFS